MYGKIDNEGKFIPAPSKVTRDGDKIIVEPMPAEERKAGGWKEVLTGEGTGRPGKGVKPQYVYEDKGDYILRRVNWVAAEPAK